MLLPRLLTAAIGIPLMLWLIFTGGTAFAVLIYIIIALSLYEYSTLLRLGSKPVNRWALYIFGLLMPLVLYFDNMPRAAGDHFAGAMIMLTVVGTLCLELFQKEKYIERMGLTLLGIFMLSWCLFQFIPLRDLPEGKNLTFLLIVTVWVMDTAAYFFGKKIGKNQLTPVSPKKTWEGAIAGFIFAIGTALLIARFTDGQISYGKAAIIGVLIGIFGQMSDIAESMIKRAVGAKDSSNMLPGHGGIMDRFDSYIFLAPVIYYFMVLVK